FNMQRAKELDASRERLTSPKATGGSTGGEVQGLPPDQMNKILLNIPQKLQNGYKLAVEKGYTNDPNKFVTVLTANGATPEQIEALVNTPQEQVLKSFTTTPTGEFKKADDKTAKRIIDGLKKKIEKDRKSTRLNSSHT